MEGSLPRTGKVLIFVFFAIDLPDPETILPSSEVPAQKLKLPAAAFQDVLGGLGRL
jgi:hypothetical protein